ncbi:histidine kinase [Actinoplanes sp. SE50]|uniref:GAF domain-containing protein n=1 Tax=unclassified Actinoplanes TaxID=2626549 RepID=UPI00023ED2E6|nr:MULTISPECIES: GAF domain-containing protein [unclassified Actinoplanes]AEV86721.1 putative GAF sensor protein [Actinoplanes sp. SE50/110]ATO85119.1 histidine kinase [Actinoplanes sp. SE50]SLM02530.1 histidine kinase [Actinoplanes sp. SE50/110]
MINNQQSTTLAAPERMRVLASIDFDNLDLRTALNRITARTAERTGLPISLATLVFNTSQMTVGATGLDDTWIAAADGTPVEWSFCANMITTGRPYVIPDAHHSEQATNPLVTIDGIGSYAGVPLTVGGQIVGAHCILGTQAHQFTPEQLAELACAAQEITALLQEFSDLD